MTDQPTEQGAKQGLWVPETAKGRSFTITGFEHSESFHATAIGDIQFTTDYVILFGLDGNIKALHHTDVRRVDETTDRSQPPVPPARPTRVEL